MPRVVRRRALISRLAVPDDLHRRVQPDDQRRLRPRRDMKRLTAIVRRLDDVEPNGLIERGELGRGDEAPQRDLQVGQCAGHGEPRLRHLMHDHAVVLARAFGPSDRLGDDVDFDAGRGQPVALHLYGTGNAARDARRVVLGDQADAADGRCGVSVDGWGEQRHDAVLAAGAQRVWIAAQYAAGPGALPLVVQRGMPQHDVRLDLLVAAQMASEDTTGVDAVVPQGAGRLDADPAGLDTPNPEVPVLVADLGVVPADLLPRLAAEHG